jgi:hypothetical protein
MCCHLRLLPLPAVGPTAHFAGANCVAVPFEALASPLDDCRTGKSRWV